MKKLFLIPFVALAMAGCSNDVTELGNGAKDTSETNYIRVNLVSANSTRANDYEAGTATENDVDAVRFYFFDNDGKAAIVKNDGKSYYDWKTVSGNGQDMDNVERILDATIVINTANKDQLPASIIAVLNPDKVAGLPETPSIDELNEVIGKYNDVDKFVMSNAVYAGNNIKMEAVSVEGHIHNSEAAALNNPVEIYVERYLAKVRLTVALTDENATKTLGDGTVIYKTSTANKEQKDHTGKDIWVKFLGWNVTATADKSYLMKSVNPTWNYTFGSESWTDAARHRSFWAQNPADAALEYGSFNVEGDTNGRFGGPNVADKVKGFTNGSINYTYVLENAATAAANATKIIIAAELVDEEGASIGTMAEYAGIRMTEDALKVALANSASIYKKTTANGKTTYTKATPEELALTLETAWQAAGQKPESGRYFVCGQMSEATYNTAETGGFEWTLSNAENAQAATLQAINAHLALYKGRVWENAKTYYYLDIRHLGMVADAVGYYGVIRNHIYDATITALSGLGTPIFDNEETIYPEKTVPDDAYIAARINILSWRVVSHDYPLEW